MGRRRNNDGAGYKYYHSLIYTCIYINRNGSAGVG
jgi:hypothetical protein